MNKLRMSLENIQGKLSRKEMRNIMAGSGDGSSCATYRCGAENKSCCSAYDICSGPNKGDVCIKR